MPQGAPPSDDSIQPPPELLEAWLAQPEIVKLGDPILRQVAKPITLATQELQDLIARMTVIMREARGLGLAAPQVGVSLRLFIYDAGDKKGLRVLINPKIVSARGEQTDPPEGCLSIPGLQGVVTRANQIRVKGYDARLKPVTVNATELEARVIQHEIDHLDGILFFDRADPETLVWAIGSEEEDDEAGKALKE
jgi:peptide deformylase